MANRLAETEETQDADMIMTSIKVERDLWRSLKIEAAKRDTSAQHLVSEAIGAFLKSTGQH